MQTWMQAFASVGLNRIDPHGLKECTSSICREPLSGFDAKSVDNSKSHPDDHPAGGGEMPATGSSAIPSPPSAPPPPPPPPAPPPPPPVAPCQPLSTSTARKPGPVAVSLPPAPPPPLSLPPAPKHPQTRTKALDKPDTDVLEQIARLKKEIALKRLAKGQLDTATPGPSHDDDRRVLDLGDESASPIASTASDQVSAADLGLPPRQSPAQLPGQELLAGGSEMAGKAHTWPENGKPMSMQDELRAKLCKIKERRGERVGREGPALC